MNREQLIGAFRVFRHRNYRMYFFGQSVSQMGTWMQRTAISWIIYSITGSEFMLGLSVFALMFPSFLFSLYGGILADRYNRYKILLTTQVASMLQAGILAILTLTHSYSVTSILILSVVLGIINAFDLPARQPMVHEMVPEKEDLPKALAFNSAVVNLARIVGPALSGLVLQRWGAGTCFLINAISFIAVLVSLLLMKLPPHQQKPEDSKFISAIKEGFDYLVHTQPIGTILAMLTVMSLLVLPYDTLLPVFAKVVFRGDAQTFGYIRSFIGLGAICGTLFLASVKKGINLLNVLLVNTVLLGFSLILFASSSYFPVAMLFAITTGFGTMSQTTIGLTIIQVETAAHMRGRVMSFLAMALFGMLPLGSLLTGFVSERIGATHTLIAQGTLAIFFAGVYYKRFKTKRINRAVAEDKKEKVKELLTEQV